MMSDQEKQTTEIPVQKEGGHEPGKEHLRAHQRIELGVEVSISSENNFYAGITDNISEGGVFVATYTPPPKGSEIELNLSLPGSPPFLVKGIVRWIRDVDEANVGDGTPAGCGVQFTDPSPAAMQAITKFVSSRDTMLIDDD